MDGNTNAKRRSSLLVDRKFQLKFTFFVVSWILALSLAYPLIIYDLFEYFMRYVADSAGQESSVVLETFRSEFLWLLSAIHSVFILLTLLISLFVSHKIAGPLYKLKKSLDGARKGRLERITFRKHDNFQDLATSYNEAVDLLFSHSKRDPAGSVQAVSAAIARLEKVLPGTSATEKDELQRAITDLKLAREKI